MNIYSIKIYCVFTYKNLSHIVSYLFAIDIIGDRCQPTIDALFVLLPFNVYVSPTRSICCARKYLTKSIINNFLLVRIFFHVKKFISSFPTHVYLYLPLSIICIFQLPFSDNAVVIFPQPDRIHVRF